MAVMKKDRVAEYLDVMGRALQGQFARIEAEVAYQLGYRANYMGGYVNGEIDFY